MKTFKDCQVEVRFWFTRTK